MSCENGIIDIAIILDISPSVVLADAITACQSGIAAIKAANLEDGGDRRVMLVTFSYLYWYYGYWVGNRALVQSGLTSDLDALSNIVGALTTGSATDIAYAVSLTRTTLESTSRAGAQVSIVLISDGQWNSDQNPGIGESDPLPVISDMLGDHTDWKLFAVDIANAAPPTGVPADVMKTVGYWGNGYSAGTTLAEITGAITAFADPCSGANINNTVHGQWPVIARLKRC